MKYLGIHKLLWFILVVAFTSIEAIIVGLVWTLHLVWHFKFERYHLLWRILHSGWSHWGGYYYSEGTIWHTIVRRYRYTFCDRRITRIINGKIQA